MEESKVNGGMMSLPIDFVNVNIERLSEMTFGGKEKSSSFQALSNTCSENTFVQLKKLGYRFGYEYLERNQFLRLYKRAIASHCKFK